MRRISWTLCALVALAACGTTGGPGGDDDDDDDDDDVAMTGLDRCLADGGALAEVARIDNNVVVAHGEITAVAFSSAGQMALASTDGAIKLWSILGEAEGTLAPEVGYDAAFGEGNPPIGGLAYAPDGDWIASGRQSGLVTLWSATTGEVLEQIAFSESPVIAVAVSPDASHVAVAHEGTEVRAWPRGSEWTDALPTQLWGVATVAYLPDGRLVTAGHDYGTPAFEVRSASAPATVESYWVDIARLGWIRAVAATTDGSRLVAAGDAILLAFDLAVADAPPRVIDVEGNLLSVAFSPGGEHVVATDDAGNVRVWDWAALAEKPALAGDATVGVRSEGAYEQLVAPERSGIIRLLGCGS
jgi:WD40 repeat protein